MPAWKRHDASWNSSRHEADKYLSFPPFPKGGQGGFDGGGYDNGPEIPLNPPFQKGEVLKLASRISNLFS